MVDFSALISRIEAAVYENGVQAITGQILQDCLKDVVNTINVQKQDGIYHITVTVDGTSGTPSGSARMDDETYTLELSFSGLKGEVGPAGPQGVKGDKGDTGERGVQGPTGATGAQGPIGPVGPQGIQGERGPAGTNGTDGVGITDIVQTTTSEEAYGTNVVTITLSNGTSKSFVVRNGGAGPQGPQGPQGVQGNTGERGADGISITDVEQIASPSGSGAANIVRITRSNGVATDVTIRNGEQGETGPQGPVGPQGPQGVKGDTGATGATGATGPQGPKGDTPEPNGEDIDFNTDGELQFANRAYNTQQPDGMGYKILRKNATFASQVTETNTIYEIRYDFELSQDIAFPSGSQLLFNGGSIIPNGYNISGIITNEFIMPEWFGAIGDGVTDDTQAFKAVVSLINSGSTGRLVLHKKTYSLSGGLSFLNNIQINGNGATLNFSSGGAKYSCIEISKTTPFTLLNTGTITGVKGESTITVGDASELSVGDYVLLYDTTDNSWSAERTYYHAGDIFKIVGISGSTVEVSEPLTQDYSTNIELYKLNTIVANISDLTVIGDFTDGETTTSLTPILARCVVDGTFKNLNLFNSNITHLSLQYCYNIVVDNIKIDTNSTAVSLNYGITVGCCKKAIIGNSICKTTRHAITIGGGENYIIPCRYVEIHGCVISTYSTTTQALDSHANAEYVAFIDNQIFGGITCSASNYQIIGNRIFSRQGMQSSLYLGNARYRTGEIRENEIHWNAVNSGDCGINIYTNVEADNDAELIIAGNKFILDYATTVTAQCADIYFRNGTTYKYKKLIVSNNVFHNGNYNLCLDFFANSSLLDYLVFCGNECRDIVQLNQTCGITESLFENNRFEKSGGSALTVNNGGTKCTITGNRSVSDNYAITFGGTTQNTNTTFIVNNNTFDITIVTNGRAAINSSKSATTVFVDNFIFSATTGKNINDIYAINSGMVVCKGNTYSVNDLRIYAKPASVTSFLREYGPTADRNKTKVGDTYFDTDLGKMIVWNGTAWVNMDGTALS